MAISGMVYQKDCLEFLSNIESNSIDHVFTSPPYNRKRNDKYDHYTDIKDDYFLWIKKVIKESIRVSRGYVFFNIQKTYYNKSDVFKIFGEFSNEIQEVLIWEKSNPMPANALNITNAYEFIFVFGKAPLKANRTYTKNIITTSVHSSMPKNHKAVMKPELSDWIISSFTKPGETIIDPFTGIGTTGISCVSNGRLFMGSELSDVYCKEANERINKADEMYRAENAKERLLIKIK
jgi:DNA modification methylase